MKEHINRYIHMYIAYDLKKEGVGVEKSGVSELITGKDYGKTNLGLFEELEKPISAAAACSLSLSLCLSDQLGLSSFFGPVYNFWTQISVKK
jgi:hypothetical protein